MMAETHKTPSGESVRTAADQISSSRAFSKCPQLVRLLKFCVEHALEGQNDYLKESILGMQVFGRGPDFDPRIDPIVRVDARRLRRKLAEYYEGDGSAEALEITFDAGKYVPGFRYRSILGRTSPASPLSSTAVLPFVNTTPGPDYLADGITDEIINALARTGLRVTSRTSAFAYKGKSYDIREIGRELRVAAVLEGSI
jgi:hypothetical protein